MKSFKLLAIGVVVALFFGPIQDNDARAQCGPVGVQADRLQTRIDTLRLDFPITYRLMCSSLSGMDDDTEASEVAGRLTVALGGCALIAGMDDCEYFIEEIFSIMSSSAQLRDMAQERSCNVPRLNFGRC